MVNICDICKIQIANKKAKYCWKCYLKTRALPKSAYKKGENLGTKHPRWTGGKMCWARKEVIKRDKGICQICKLNEPEIMDVAHIIPVKGDKNRRYKPQDINNLIVLCPNCHRRLDKGIIKLQ